MNSDKPMVRKRATAVGIFATVASLLCIGGNPAAAAAPTEIKIGISAQVITMFPLWMAEAGGFYEKEGLKVQIINTNGGSRGIQVLLSGEIQAMHVGLAPLVPANGQGADLRLILSSSNTIPFTFFSKPDVKTGADLKGGKVGISTFSSESDIATTFSLMQLGLSRKDVTILQLGGTSQRLAALIAGQVKAVPLLEPATTIAREKGLYPLVDLAASNVPWVFDSVAMTRSYIQSHRDIVMRLARAYVEGAYLALGDERRAKEVIAKEFKTHDAKVIDASYRLYKKLMPLDAAPSRPGAENLFKQLKAIGKQVTSTKVEDYVDYSVVEGLQKEGLFAALKQRYHLQ